jgi:putative transcription factor
MPECDICGKEVEQTRTVNIDGGVFSVCDVCSKLGEEVYSRPVSVHNGFHKESSVEDIGFDEKEVEQDFSARIRAAREKFGLSQEDAAKRIGIHESVLKKMESHGFRPDDHTIKKVEHGLGIRIFKRTREDLLDKAERR